jgi:hypothetical protein
MEGAPQHVLVSILSLVGVILVAPAGEVAATDEVSHRHFAKRGSSLWMQRRPSRGFALRVFMAASHLSR